jgi:hypothetical protein
MTYTEYRLRVLDTKERSTRRKPIRMYKIQWNHHTEEEVTWETESYLQHNFPDFFQANLEIDHPISSNPESRDKILFRGEGCDTQVKS